VAATTIAPAIAIACLNSPGTAKRSAITARIRGDRNVMRAICSRTRVTLLAISPTMIAPIGPEL
jgi:hypothetical protein